MNLTKVLLVLAAAGAAYHFGQKHETEEVILEYEAAR